MFRVVSDDGVKQKVVIVGVVRPNLAPLPLQLQVVVNGLHGLLRPGPQTSFETLHFQELTDVLEHTVDLGRDRDSELPVELLKVLNAGPEVRVQLLTKAGHDHLIKLDLEAL